MTFRQYARLLCAAAALSTIVATAASAQTRPAAAPPAPTPTALLVAKELIDLKGATKAFDPLVNGVIEYHKNFFLQNNPNLGKDLDAVAKKLAGELAPRRAELQQNLTRIYAQHFTEQELKDALAFYKTPLGRKLIAEEPQALEEAMAAADKWSQKFADEVNTKFRAEMKKLGHNMI